MVNKIQRGVIQKESPQTFGLYGSEVDWQSGIPVKCLVGRRTFEVLAEQGDKVTGPRESAGGERR